MSGVAFARTCARSDGRPKLSYESRAKAKAAANKGLHPYPCAVHGWHLGAKRAPQGHPDLHPDSRAENALAVEH